MKVVNLDDIRHGVRVANLSLKISKKLNLSKSETQAIYNSCFFHDIGKAYLDQSILNKPSKLTIEERKHIEKHSCYSYEEALQLGFPSDVALNILYHHENYDGTGYPTGSKGKNIPLASRIIRICDVFDALISDRPYRKGLSLKEAIDIIKRKESYYCPIVYKTFLNLNFDKSIEDTQFENEQFFIGKYLSDKI